MKKKYRVKAQLVIHRIDEYEVEADNQYEAEIYYAQNGELIKEGDPIVEEHWVESTTPVD